MDQTEKNNGTWTYLWDFKDVSIKETHVPIKGDIVAAFQTVDKPHQTEHNEGESLKPTKTTKKNNHEIYKTAIEGKIG